VISRHLKRSAHPCLDLRRAEGRSVPKRRTPASNRSSADPGNIFPDALGQCRTQLAFRFHEGNQYRCVSSFDFMLRVGSHQSRATGHPCIRRITPNAQRPAQCHHKLNAMVCVYGGKVAWSPDDHGGGPQKGAGGRADQHEIILPRSIRRIAHVAAISFKPSHWKRAIFFARGQVIVPAADDISGGQGHGPF
jgi:hypothetical protein